MSKNKRKEYKPPKRRQPFFKVIGGLLKALFYRKIKVVNLAGEISEKSIFVSNHAGKHGPMALEFNLPFNVKWGAWQMLAGFKTRWKYLRDVHYMQELGKGKFAASFRATADALFSKMLYKGVKFIGTYPDLRFVKTVNESIAVLDSNMSVSVFPENAAEVGGYLDEADKFLPGFVALAEQYYKKRGEDLPVYPVYYSHKKKLLIIDRPQYVNELRRSGMDRNDVAEHFRLHVVDLYRSYVLSDTEAVASAV